MKREEKEIENDTLHDIKVVDGGEGGGEKAGKKQGQIHEYIANQIG